jgi:putative transposase
VVFVPKYRKKQLYGKMRRQVRGVLLDLSRQIGVDVLEGHLMPDDVHLCLRVAPKYSIAHVIGFLKGKSAVRIHRALGHQRMTGLHFWSRGYCVSPVGLDETTIRRYIREQEDRDKDQQCLEFA